MPRLIKFEELEKNKKYTYVSYIKVTSHNDCFIRSPLKIGTKHKGKLVRVTLEVLGDEN